jgi:broad specificity phosphatase PhoE
LQGWTDVPINDLGRRQAYEKAQLNLQAGFDAVWNRTPPK